MIIIFIFYNRLSSTFTCFLFFLIRLSWCLFNRFLFLHNFSLTFRLILNKFLFLGNKPLSIFSIFIRTFSFLIKLQINCIKCIWLPIRMHFYHLFTHIWHIFIRCHYHYWNLGLRHGFLRCSSYVML